jgi:hypothetical protein
MAKLVTQVMGKKCLELLQRNPTFIVKHVQALAAPDGSIFVIAFKVEPPRIAKLADDRIGIGKSTASHVRPWIGAKGSPRRGGRRISSRLAAADGRAESGWRNAKQLRILRLGPDGIIAAGRGGRHGCPVAVNRSAHSALFFFFFFWGTP